eukprot:TRINITY_DN217_c0_g1_i3.p1 TRINITY_DN217_c0_g1~~TRINITY_DN217_c0_g1_i3.p1  ORF type:complete len:338 (-),score=81.19 TRINITY_DN217_c0_g1_i3:830-1843(-)
MRVPGSTAAAALSLLTACCSAAQQDAAPLPQRELVDAADPCTYVPDPEGEAMDWTWNPACYKPGSTMVAPIFWGSKYPFCKGVRQSPIDIVTAATVPNCVPDAGLHFGATYTPGTCTFDAMHPELGHGLELNYGDCELATPGASPTMTVNGKTYKALQVHFHSASEHTIDGVAYDADVHIVHVNVADPNDLVVLGVMVDAIESADGFDPLVSVLYPWWHDLNHAAIFKAAGFDPNGGHRDRNLGITTVEVADVADPYTLLPADKSYFTYLGSLTTPPCSEIVTWVVFTTPITVSASEFWWHKHSLSLVAGPYLNLFGGNNRPTQLLNGRVVSQCHLH